MTDMYRHLQGLVRQKEIKNYAKFIKLIHLKWTFTISLAASAEGYSDVEDVLGDGLNNEPVAAVSTWREL